MGSAEMHKSYIITALNHVTIHVSAVIDIISLNYIIIYGLLAHISKHA